MRELENRPTNAPCECQEGMMAAYLPGLPTGETLPRRNGAQLACLGAAPLQESEHIRLELVFVLRPPLHALLLEFVEHLGPVHETMDQGSRPPPGSDGG